MKCKICFHGSVVYKQELGFPLHLSCFLWLLRTLSAWRTLVCLSCFRKLSVIQGYPTQHWIWRWETTLYKLRPLGFMLPLHYCSQVQGRTLTGRISHSPTLLRDVGTASCYGLDDYPLSVDGALCEWRQLILLWSSQMGLDFSLSIFSHLQYFLLIIALVSNLSLLSS